MDWLIDWLIDWLTDWLTDDEVTPYFYLFCLGLNKFETHWNNTFLNDNYVQIWLKFVLRGSFNLSISYEIPFRWMPQDVTDN